MATTFTVAIARRPLTEDMFADLGYPQVTITPVQLTAHNMSYQFDLVEDLTPAQILRARIRVGTRQAAHEAQMIAALNYDGTLDTNIVSLDALIALGSRTNAQNSADIKALAQITKSNAQGLKGLLRWVGKDAMGL